MYIAIMGYGVVGSGVAALIRKNNESIAKNSLQPEMEVKYILDLRSFPGDPFENLVISDFTQIVNDDEVSIVVETMGGIHPAYDFVLECLKKGKSVVTSNKELVAVKGCELLKAAKENNANFLFEASVGGGIPIIRPIHQCLAANEIEEVAGILNGTTNFILTKMINESMTFEDALLLAQQNGYAERDPSADIDGIDACRKICILAALCFGKHVYPEFVHTEGIRKISLADVEYALSWDGAIKLIARAKKLESGKVTLSVSPAFVRKSCLLASTDDVFNAVLIRGNAVGDVIFYGRGAGKFPTASAVVADVIDCARHIERRKVFGWEEGGEDFIADYRDNETAFYIRLITSDKEKTLASLAEVFGETDIINRSDAPENELAIAIKPVREGDLGEKLASVFANEIASVIRITDY